MRLFLAWSLVVATAVCAESPAEDYGLAEALIRYEVSNTLSDSHSNICISVLGRDIPPGVVKHLNDTGLTIVSSGDPACETSMPIGEPRVQSDGTVEVPYGYYAHCLGDGCVTQGKMMFAYMRHEKDGWRVLRLQGGVSF